MSICGNKYSFSELCVLVILSAAPTFSHWFYLSSLNENYFNEVQLARHVAVLQHTADAPWVYRQLSEWILVPFIDLSELLTQSPTIGFLSFRFVLTFVILMSLRVLCSSLKSNWLVSSVVVSILMSTATFDSDLSFNTYAEIAFAVLLVNTYFFAQTGHGYKKILLFSLVFFGVLNRETLLLVLLAVIGAEVFQIMPGSRQDGLITATKALFRRVDLLVAGIATYLSNRLLVGDRPPMIPYGVHFGHETLLSNLRLESLDKPMVFWIIFAVFLLTRNRFTSPYEKMCFCLLAVWIPVHFVGSFLVESRVLLVPVSLIVPVLFQSDRFNPGNVVREVQ